MAAVAVATGHALWRATEQTTLAPRSRSWVRGSGRSAGQAALLILPVNLALAQQPTAQERDVALKASLAASQAILKSYEWVETTVVSVKGDEKSRQMNRCYHGADGNVQKIPLTTPPPAKKNRGLRGRIAAAKQEEMADYMKEAVALVKQYMPNTAGDAV